MPKWIEIKAGNPVPTGWFLARYKNSPVGQPAEILHVDDVINDDLDLVCTLKLCGFDAWAEEDV